MPDPQRTSYDLIIVGAGPAGAAAALYASRLGLKTLLLDKSTFPRDKICGDALSGKAVAILLELGLLDRIRDLPGALINKIVFSSPDHVDAWIDLERHTLHDIGTGRDLPMEGFVIRRTVFDAFLFREARNSVDACIEGFAVKDLVRENGIVNGVTGSANGQQQTYRANLVLGCDGFNSIVARRTGQYRHDGRHWVVALRCYYENVTGLKDQIELHFVNEVLPGYFWAFPLENGYANVGIGMLHSSLKRRKVNLKDALQSVITRPPFDRRFANARAMEEPIGWNLPIGSIRRKSYGNGFMLLGDAAGLIDPFTGEGIGNALYAARFAAQTAAEARSANDFSESFLKRYEDRLWDAIGDELRTSKRLQDLGRWRPLLNLVIQKAAQNQQISDLITGMIANAVPKKKLFSPLFYFGLLFK